MEYISPSPCICRSGIRSSTYPQMEGDLSHSPQYLCFTVITLAVQILFA